MRNLAATKFQAICPDKFPIVNFTRSEAKASLDGNKRKKTGFAEVLSKYLEGNSISFKNAEYYETTTFLKTLCLTLYLKLFINIFYLH